MSLDHYVSQVYLRQFTDLQIAGRLYAIRKSDGFKFEPRTQDVCRIENGNTNPYLSDERAIESFISTIEPKYNYALEVVRSGEINQEAIRVISGFISFIQVCSPGGMRVITGPLQKIVESSARIMDKRGMFGASPPSLGGRSLSKLIDDGDVQIRVDPQYPQSFGINSIKNRAAQVANFDWEILMNSDPQTSPFMTSDFPSTVELSPDPRILYRVIPLSPDIALRIKPCLERRSNKPDFKYNSNKTKFLKLNHSAVSKINRDIVRCAETIVFYNKPLNWVENFVLKNSQFRIEPIQTTIPYKTGYLEVSSQRIVPFNA